MITKEILENKQMDFNLFINRHIGSNNIEQKEMLHTLGYNNINSFINDTIPASLISVSDSTTALPQQEYEALENLKKLADKNKVFKNFIGFGFYESITPAVIKRNVLENPGWYTAYTPYQAEISQGRLEALLNFQQMIMDLTGFNLANASLLDEATSAAEAMAMARKINNDKSSIFFVDENAFPQTIEVIKTRAKYFDIEIQIGNINNLKNEMDNNQYFGVFLQNPNLYGEINDYSALINNIKQNNQKCVIIMACDILSLVLFKSPKTMGADIAIGSTQRFGVPLGFGGPSAAYIATSDENRRLMPGRIIGVSQDSKGKKALRMSLQTREQHIRREKATSNICTAQALLANMASFYAIYHGKEGLTAIANNIHKLSIILQHNLIKLNIKVLNQHFVFDTIVCELENISKINKKLEDNGYLAGNYKNKLFISLGETSTIEDIVNLIQIITDKNISQTELTNNIPNILNSYSNLFRKDNILTHPVFNSYHSETQMMRYLKYLENKDFSLVHGMIPLGSCTMKLNSASELEGLSWKHFANIHPFAPRYTTEGYLELINTLKEQLKSITGFDDISMQPNSGAQGEYAGLLAIRQYQKSINQEFRNICLIPKSAHGTNPATAQMMGLEVVVVQCDNQGNVDLIDVENKAKQYKDNLCCLMITYPSTHGVFEANIKHICSIIHENGGQVYMDGANLNALVGLVKTADLGADVSHINLHKTFAIPHGGGGPGMGPIGVRKHLSQFLPMHIMYLEPNNNYTGASVSSSPFGSASILIISYMYITMLGNKGLKQSTEIAILHANYMAHKLKPYYPILYTGQNNKVAHECIIDLRPIKAETGISEVDIAKRLMDYNFHAPTMSFPVAGTLMIEPTESESKKEIDRFIEAMISIYEEIEDIKAGKFDKVNNPLKNSPHTLTDLMNWGYPYSQEIGCFPVNELKQNKLFPSVNRIDDAFGDRNFICNCFDFNN